MGGDLSSVQGVQKELASVCSVCGCATELFELPGRAEKLCLACSADLATTVVLRTEIDTATLAGQNADDLVAEFAELSRRLLTRAQSADALGSW
jgi:hypothetical protein